MPKKTPRTEVPSVLRALEYEAAYTGLIKDVAQGRRSHDPVLSQIQVIRTEHQGPREYPSGAGSYRRMEAEGGSVILTGDIERGDIEAHTVALYEMIDGVFVQQAEQVLEHLRENAGEGRSFQVIEGREPTWDLYIEMLETFPLTFDGHQKPQMPTLMPVQHQVQLQSQPLSPEQAERIKQIVESKRAEHVAATPTRRLS